MTAQLLLGRAGPERALELALAQALLAEVADGERPALVRCYRPLPTVAFGRQDTFAAGFADACSFARERGFEPVVRAAGGHAAAYHEECLVIDEIRPEERWLEGIHERFRIEAERQAAVLAGLGIDARVGALPGEYCAGEYSVGARGAVKLIGSAQRLVRGAWLMSTVVIVDRADPLRDVLDGVYRALGLEWDPATVGSVAAEAPGVGVESVQQALLGAYAGDPFAPGALGDRTLKAARGLLARYLVV